MTKFEINYENTDNYCKFYFIPTLFRYVSKKSNTEQKDDNLLLELHFIINFVYDY